MRALAILDDAMTAAEQMHDKLATERQQTLFLVARSANVLTLPQ